MAEFEMLAAGGTEAQFQQALAYLFPQGATTGLVNPGVITGLQVTQTATAGTSVLISAGAGLAQDTVLNGSTLLVNNASKTQDVLVANPSASNPRNDIVVFDAATTTIRVVSGTPNAIPSDPTVPTTAFPLARLRILGSATSIPAAQIDDLRKKTGPLGSAVFVGSLTALNALPTYIGAVAIRTDEGGRRYWYDGANWIGQVRSESGVLSHSYGGGVGPVSSSVTFSKPFTAVPALTISCNTYVLQTYYGALSTAGVTVSSRGFNSVIPASATYSISWTATGW